MLRFTHSSKPPCAPISVARRGQNQVQQQPPSRRALDGQLVVFSLGGLRLIIFRCATHAARGASHTLLHRQVLNTLACLPLPQVIAILTLSDAAVAAFPGFVEAFVAACAQGTPQSDDPMWAASQSTTALQPGSILSCSRHKQRFSLIHADATAAGGGCSGSACLDAITVADVMVVLLPVDSLTSDDTAVAMSARAVLPCLRAQGMPPALGALVNVTVQGTAAPGEAPKQLPPASVARARASARTAGDDIMACALGIPEPRCLPADGGADCSEFVRQLGTVRLAPPVWRTLRPYVLIEHVGFEVTHGGGGDGDGGNAVGVLAVTGHIRGAAMWADQIVHLPGHGEFLIDSIHAAAPATSGHDGMLRFTNADAGLMDSDGVGDLSLLSAPVEATRESLQAEHIPDPLAGEQTWPTAEDLADAADGDAVRARVAAAQEPPTRLARRPKGWSDYQAAWIKDFSDEEGEGPYDDDGREDDGMQQQQQQQNGNGADVDDTMRDVKHDGAGEAEEESEEESFLGEDEMTQDEAMAAARHDSERRLALRRAADAAAANEAEFPDEVDAPLGSRASVRFARYRGLKSFRTSAWDPFESLPRDYARIFSFQNFSRTRRRALAGPTGNEGAQRVAPGTRVCVRLAGVPASVAAGVLAAWQQGRPQIALGLLQHEGKLSVLHAAVSATSGYAGPPVKSKSALTWRIGFRRLESQSCIFSQDGNGDKFKYERYLPPSGTQVVVTSFGPITYGPAPVLLFTTTSSTDSLDGAVDAAPHDVLAATGTLRGVDPERVVLKRAILTGFPHKVHKRKAVIRFMFHCPEDVRWFKPLELWTKYGRHGKIREPLGTHGSMKCAFDGVLQQRDTVCVSLYKRVFPKLLGQRHGVHGGGDGGDAMDG